MPSLERAVPPACAICHFSFLFFRGGYFLADANSTSPDPTLSPQLSVA